MEGVQLREFVRHTLVEIAEGVRGANKDLKESMPEGHSVVFCLDVSMGGHSEHHRGIEFDVAVTASKGGKEASGFMVALASLGGGARAERLTGNESFHRIKFEVSLNTLWA